MFLARSLSALLDTKKHLTRHQEVDRVQEEEKYRSKRSIGERLSEIGAPAHNEPGVLLIKGLQQEGPCCYESVRMVRIWNG